MNKLFAIFLFVLVFSVEAQVIKRQEAIATTNIIGGILRTPGTIINRRSSTHEFRKMLAESRPQNDEQCVVNGVINPANLSSLLDVAGRSRDQQCQCVAWGSCEKTMCSCEILCPKGFSILSRPEARTTKELSREENSLAFRNAIAGEISNIKGNNGYCWGHARVTSQFNRLGFFKGNQRPPHNLQSEDPAEYRRALDFYKKIIDNIVDNKPVDIPGFRNLNEMSSEPELQQYLADKVAKSWARHAMSWQGLSSVLNIRGRSERSFQQNFESISQRIENNMQPTVVISYKNGGAPHALLVSHVERSESGRTSLCMRDSNQPENIVADCKLKLLYLGDQLFYEENGEINELKTLRIAHNENGDSVQQALRLRSKCADEKGCETSLSDEQRRPVDGEDADPENRENDE